MRLAAAGIIRFCASDSLFRQACSRMALASLALFLAACASQPQTQGGTVVRPSTSGVAAGARSVDASQPVPVALLLPTGSADSEVQAISRDMEDAARLAVEQSAGLARIELQLRDSGGTAATAEAAARQAAVSGVPLLLGPAFAAEAQAVAPVARETGVTTLSLSSFARYASPPLYILGLTPEDEIDRIFSYAASQGLTRIATVTPRNLYGDVVLAAARKAAAQNGMSIVYSLEYPYSNQGAQDAISEEGPALAASTPQAVFVPEDNGLVLTSILAYLGLHDVRTGIQQLLGTARWETGGGLRAPELVGGWYPSLDPEAMAAFENSFQQRYGRAPRLQAAVAYDGVRAAAELLAQARRSGTSAPFTQQALTSQAGFSGATGRFRLRPDGRITRAMPIMEVGPTGPIMRAPAAPAGS